MRRGTLFDNLREQVNKNGAWKSPSPQSEVPIINSSVDGALMDTSGLGMAWTTSRSWRTFTAGDLTPQIYGKQQPANVDDLRTDAGMIMNARAANPSRGITPRSPLMTRR